MHVTQEKRPGSQIGFRFVIPMEQVKRGYDKTLREISAASDIPGFRKGKAPVSMVIRAVGKERVKAAALEDLLETTVKKALKEANIEPITSFKVDGGTDALLEIYNPEADLSFSGSVEVYPEVTLGNYKGLRVQVERAEPDYAKEVDETLERYRGERATLIPVSDRPAQMGDVVILDFTATFADGSPVEGSTAHDFDLVLEPGNLYPGFCEGIVGMGIDDIKEIVVTIPEDYFDSQLAGKVLKFRVTLNDLKARELPDLDDQFAQAISSFSTLEELRSFLRKRAELNAVKQSQKNLYDAILAEIMKDLEIDLPESLVEKEVVSMVTQTLENLQENQGIPVDDLIAATRANWSELSKQLRPEAILRVRRSVVIGELIDREKIEVGETEFNLAVDEYIRNNQGKVTQENLKSVGQQIYQSLIFQKTMNWLAQHTQVTWVDREGNRVEAPLELPALVDDSSESPESAQSAESFVTSGVIEAEFSGSTPEVAAVGDPDPELEIRGGAEAPEPAPADCDPAAE
jgi:trigger factor